MSVIKVTFSRAVDVSTVKAGVIGDNPETFTFLVTEQSSQQPLHFVPGFILPDAADPSVVRFTFGSRGDPQTAGPGNYKVTLWGDASTNLARPAIKDMRDHRNLDGESIWLPSGDGTEGGNFEFQFIIERPNPKISVIIPSLNEANYLRHTVDQLRNTLPEGSEIIVVDDGSTDGSTDFLDPETGDTKLLRCKRLGASVARNHGAVAADGEIIVFSDAHVEVPPGWSEPMIDLLNNPNVGGVSPVISVMGQPEAKGFGWHMKGPELRTEWLCQRGTSAYPVPLLPGGFLAMRRDTFEAVGGFDSGIVQYGWEDTELGLRLWLLGYQLWVVPQVDVAHLFREKHPYIVEWNMYLYNMLRLVFAHFSVDRVARVLEAIKGYPGFASALARAVESDIWQRRTDLAMRRLRSDDWFFNSFGMIC